jgi:hypothetical protein
MMKVVVGNIWGEFEDPFPGYDILGKGRAKGEIVIRIDG